MSVPQQVSVLLNRVSARRVEVRLLGALAGCVLIAGFGSAGASAASPTPMVNLGAASTYAVLSGASVGNTVSAAGAPHTTLRGDLGVSAISQPTGFPPGVVTGAVNVGADAVPAHAAVLAAYNEVSGRTGGTALAGALVGASITPGLYTISGAVSNTGTVTLDAGGDPNAVFVFQVNGALATAAGSHFVLIGGAQASRVFWQVNGAGAIGANASFVGTLMAHDAVAVGNSSVVNGRAIALTGALTLDADEVYSAPPAVTIVGGGIATTNIAAPMISGTTDVEAPALVTVTINGQTLIATPGSGGAWSVTSALLPNATYAITASTIDGAGNLGTATQQLTVDTVLPVITLNGGPSMLTNDATPTIGGTSDAAPGTVVHVAVDSLMLTALVQLAGTWNVTPEALADGTHPVTVSVSDLAGNLGIAGQALTVDTAAPAVTITAGAHALTNHAAPVIAGTAAVAPGSTVTVNLADETLFALVQSDGTWSVTAAALSEGPHRVIMTVADAAGNPASFTQTLTVDTVPPVIAITGGASATTNALAPTITGTSDAAPGTTVSVSIASQVMTTLVQTNGSWNATPPPGAYGTWTVGASIQDPAGNVGSAQQTLTIVADPPVGPSAPAPTGSTGPGAAPILPAVLVAPFTAVGAVAPVGPVTPGRSVNAVAGVTVTRAGNQKFMGALSIGTKLTASTRGRVVATVSGTVKIRGIKAPIKLTRLTAVIDAGRSATLSLRPKGTKTAVKAALFRIKAAIEAKASVTAAITVRIVDAAGNTRVLVRAVKIT